MRHSQSEKMEIIRIVENSKIGVKRTLDELSVNRSTFYEWYRRYKEEGYDGLENRSHCPKQFWNAIPHWEAERVVETSLELPDKVFYFSFIPLLFFPNNNASFAALRGALSLSTL